VYLTRIPKPVVAAVNGAAYGSGLALALHCDLRIAAQSAKFRAPFADFGLIGELGIPWHLSRLAGAGRAMEWMMTRRVVDAGEALAAGLVCCIFPDEAFRADAMAYVAGLIGNASTRSLGVIKRQAWGVWEQSLPESAMQGGVETALAIRSDDFRARVAAVKK
jgi:enoyl-CoA hydratase/carnithine racemase